MRRKYITIPLVLALFYHSALWGQGYDVPQEKKLSAEEKARRGDKLKGFRVLADIGIPERVDITDSIAMGSHNYVSVERRSLGVAYAGNTNQPWQSKLFFDRDYKGYDFIFLNGYQGMMYTPDNVLFYDTKTPLTYVHYRKNFSDNVLEEVLNGTIAFNLGKRLNLGISADHISALGYYANSKSRNIDYRIFGSYRSDRYDMWAYIANDYYKQQENGGIEDLSYISNPDKYSNGRVRISSLDIPVQLTSPLFNRIRHGHGYLSHRYKLGYYQRSDKFADSTTDGRKTDSLIFVPVGSISHQLHYSHASRRMIATESSKLWSTFFGTPISNITNLRDTLGNVTTIIHPNDVAAIKSLKNTLSLSLLEGFKPWVKAGLSAYIRAENYWVSNPESINNLTNKTDKYFSTYVGGELRRRGGTGLNFSAKGELAILGYDLGAFTLLGDISTQFALLNKSFSLIADAKLLNYRPPFFAGHYHGTWSWQDEDFNFSRRLELGAKASINSWGTWVEARTASLQNYIYWGTDAKAKQSSELIQVNMLKAGHKYQVGPLGWNLEAAYQLSTSKSITPLPNVTARGDIYFDFMIAKVLQVQLGAEAYWHSAYYAPYYHAPTMQFINQDISLIGGKAPLMNAYANFRMRTTRFYARMFNVGEALFENDRQSMAKYVYNPMHLQIGVVIDLKN